VAPKGGRQANLGFEDGFAQPSETRAVFLVLCEMPALPIMFFLAGGHTEAPTVYLGSNGHRYKFIVTGGTKFNANIKSASARY
jgi:hypothetical protein